VVERGSAASDSAIPIRSRRKAIRHLHYTSLKDLNMMKFVYRFRRDEEGAALVEYGMLVGLIAVICIGAVTLLGQDVSSLLSTVATTLQGI
jgi:pilus assembly protein Flp/PilA